MSRYGIEMVPQEKTVLMTETHALCPMMTFAHRLWLFLAIVWKCDNSGFLSIFGDIIVKV